MPAAFTCSLNEPFCITPDPQHFMPAAPAPPACLQHQVPDGSVQPLLEQGHQRSRGQGQVQLISKLGHAGEAHLQCMQVVQPGRGQRQGTMVRGQQWVRPPLQMHGVHVVQVVQEGKGKGRGK